MKSAGECWRVIESGRQGARRQRGHLLAGLCGLLLAVPAFGSPTLSIEPASGLEFVAAVGGVSDVQRLTLRNGGDEPVVVSLACLGGAPVTGLNAREFEVSSQDNCLTCERSVSLAKGEQCQLLVRFRPGAAGERSATLTLLSNDPRAPHVVSLRGNRDAAPLSQVGTWFFIEPGKASASLTVDPDNVLTAWVLAEDGGTWWTTVNSLHDDGTFETEDAVSGRVAPDFRSATIVAKDENGGTTTIVLPRAQAVAPVPVELARTWGTVRVLDNGDRINVKVAVDPGGNATFWAHLKRKDRSGLLFMFGHFLVNPEGQLIDPTTREAAGTLAVKGAQATLSFLFQAEGYEANMVLTVRPE